jgi:hypothetical protein
VLGGDELADDGARQRDVHAQHRDDPRQAEGYDQLAELADERARRQKRRQPRLGRSRQKYIAGVILMQLIPFADSKALKLYDRFEKAVYAEMA